MNFLNNIFKVKYGYATIMFSVLFFFHFLRSMNGENVLDLCLIGALAQGQERFAEEYIRSGANVNAAIDGIPLLHLATVKNDERTVKFLLQHNANVDVRDRDGDSPLLVSAIKGYAPTADLLLTHGASVDMKMILAAGLERHADVLDLLVGCHCVQESSTQDEKNKALLVMSKKPNNPALYRALVAGAHPDSQNERLNTPLHFAATQGNLRSANDLLAYHARVDIPNNTGKIPLHYACWKGHTELVNKLIDADSPLNAQDENGETPLHFAAGYGHFPVVKALVDRWANATVRNGQGKDPEDLASTPEVKRYLQATKASYIIFGLAVTYLNIINKLSGAQ